MRVEDSRVLVQPYLGRQYLGFIEICPSWIMLSSHLIHCVEKKGREANFNIRLNPAETNSSGISRP
jgi:hypothetical protein